MRRVGTLLLLLCPAIPLFIVPAVQAGWTLTLNETDTFVLLRNGQTIVSLALENPARHSLEAEVRIELIGPNDIIQATAERDVTLVRGQSKVLIPIPLQLAWSKQSERNELLWYRMRYRISPSSRTGESFAKVEGIVSLSEIAPDIFDLRVAAPAAVLPGMPCRVHVSALHPLTSRPVTNVNIQAIMTFSVDNVEKTITLTGVTDDYGLATLDFNLPRVVDRDEDDVELEVTARLGEFMQEANADIELDTDSRVLVVTDKPIYQPGQTIHVRALVFDSARHAQANEKVLVTVMDQSGSAAYRTSIKTSRFGVCNTDWEIPENARLGEYSISVEVEGGGYDSQSEQTIKISRYDLPNFTVQTKPDKPYYVPGQQAEVEIRADYLFGQPVKRGHVRVIQETSPQWDYEQQKYIADEGDKYEGETDDEGRFIAHINLEAQHNELASEDYERFHDLTYAAYFTDPTTNRTEQRRFDLRVTKDAIHVYIDDSAYRQTANFPLQFYVSTYYADGTPVQCDVSIVDDNTSENSSKPSPNVVHSETLRTIRTNRYGLAKVSGLSPAHRDGSDSEIALGFTAHDLKGGFGRHSNTFSYSKYPSLRIETDKILYSHGDPIRATLTASEPNMRAIVSVWQRGVNLYSEVVQLRNGRALFTTPFHSKLNDGVTILAYPISSAWSGRYDVPVGSRTVLFPRNSDLNLSVQLDKQTYRPGENAVAEFSVRTPDGSPVESALGIIIYDRAVEERARTDSEFRGTYGFNSAYNYLHGAAELSGVSLRDLERLNPSKPIPDDLELLAEMLLGGGTYYPNIFGNLDYPTDQREIFRESVETRMTRLREALAAHYKNQREYPTDEESLRRVLAEEGLGWDDVRDPWNLSHRAEFSIDRDQDVLSVRSAGADKRFDTPDDFIAAKLSWPYFARTGETITRIIDNHHAQTDEYIRDEGTLRTVLAREGLQIETIRDRWGHTYSLEFGISGFYYTVSLKSGGPNGKLETAHQSSSDDFAVWNVYTDYFEKARANVDEALIGYFKSTGHFPQNESDLRGALAGSMVDLGRWLDPWGNKYYLRFSTESWAAKTIPQIHRVVFGDATPKHDSTAELVEKFNYVRLNSRGADGREGTSDDFAVAGFTRLQVEEASQNRKLKLSSLKDLLAGSTGAISGTVLDPNGAVVSGAVVKVTRLNWSKETDDSVARLSPYSRETTSNDEGVYLIGNLPAGFYQVEINVPGFASYEMDLVPVRSSSVTKVDNTLSVAGAIVNVEVSGEVPEASTSQSSISSRSRGFSAEYGKSTGPDFQVAQNSTPRLREYFPETLVWQPLLETDVEGHARLNFKLADNITTWKMSVISSTVDGEVGIAEKEIRAFQPFFVEHDPPRVLTVGDKIQLPIVLRNYLPRPQSVSVEIKPESWFTLQGPAQQSETVSSGDAARAIFPFQATASVKDGKQRITAFSTDASDAIEKPVSVHPDGMEMTLTSSYLMNESARMNANFPDDAIIGSATTELKIYPNLFAHVIESIESIMKRPYGCGEQTISSTYPSLLAIKTFKRSGISSPIQAKAQRYLQQGYERLLNYRAEAGGFNYWGHGEADLALTAYALRFLNDAREFMIVDEDLMQSTRAWLIKQQRADGSWPTRNYWSENEQNRRTVMLTAFIAHVLAVSVPDSTLAIANSSAEIQKAPVTLALDYLKLHLNQLDDPYSISLYALTSLELRDRDRAAGAIVRLRSLAHADNDATYWETDTSTPFYGWGLAGRIETTALAVQALELFDQVDSATERRNGKTDLADSSTEREGANSTNAVIADRGMLFLLNNKDRYGVWLSTQATVNVLDALISNLGDRNSPASSNIDPNDQTGNDEAEIIINGRHATTVKLPSSDQLTGPIQQDLTQYVSAKINSISVHRANPRGPAAIQVVQSYYVPWTSPSINGKASASSRTLRFAVSYDKTVMEVGADVTCTVETERTGTSGYGMLLAEIGLPPGADVDRESLEKAVKGSNWGVSQYDVLPDRVIVYLWPQREGTNFEFKFRLRFGIAAQTAPSLIYDYYNPEARTVVAPTKFVVR